MQVLLSVVLNVFNLVLLIHYRPYLERQDQISETLNSAASLLVLYCLMLFSGQLVGDKKTLSDFGDLLIAISIGNLILNVLPLLWQLLKSMHKRCLLKLYRRVVKWVLKKRRHSAVRRRLQSRSEVEVAYGRHLERRATVAADNLAQFR